MTLGMRRRWRAVAREGSIFALIGVVATAADIALFNWLAFAHGWPPVAAKALSHGLGIAGSYAANARWTWPRRAGSGRAKQAALFTVVSVGGLGVSELCLLASHYGLGLTGAMADNVSANGVGLVAGAGLRFLAYRRWVFRVQGEPARGASNRSVLRALSDDSTTQTATAALV